MIKLKKKYTINLDRKIKLKTNKTFTKEHKKILEFKRIRFNLEKVIYMDKLKLKD
jgi:hypothetical protein